MNEYRVEETLNMPVERAATSTAALRTREARARGEDRVANEELRDRIRVLEAQLAERPAPATTPKRSRENADEEEDEESEAEVVVEDDEEERIDKKKLNTREVPELRQVDLKLSEVPTHLRLCIRWERSYIWGLKGSTPALGAYDADMINFLRTPEAQLRGKFDYLITRIAALHQGPERKQMQIIAGAVTGMAAAGPFFGMPKDVQNLVLPAYAELTAIWMIVFKTSNKMPHQITAEIENLKFRLAAPLSQLLLCAPSDLERAPPAVALADLRKPLSTVGSELSFRSRTTASARFLGACHNCGIVGHRAAQCRRPKSYDSGSQKVEAAAAQEKKA